MDKVRAYRRCFVPMCKNTQKITPDKVFVSVPQDKTRRQLWFKLARRIDEPISSNYYCCEDHFNLKEDMENFVIFKLMGAPIKMKEHAAPHIFDCQPDRRTAASTHDRAAFKKLNHKRMISEILSHCETHETNENRSPNVKSNNEIVPKKVCKQKEISTNENCASISFSILTENNKINDEIDFSNIPSKSDSINIEKSNAVPLIVTEKEGEVLLQSNDKIEINKKCTWDKENKNTKVFFRSKKIQCNIKCSTVEESCQTLPNTVNKMCSPINVPTESDNSSAVSAVVTDSSKTITTGTTGSEYEPCHEDYLQYCEEQDLQAKRSALHLTNYFISTQTKQYIGIPNDWLWIVDELHKRTCLSTENIKLTLMKI
ncbi:hypothetical protein ACS0PU_010413 [Formica fusca]